VYVPQALRWSSTESGWIRRQWISGRLPMGADLTRRATVEAEIRLLGCGIDTE